MSAQQWFNANPWVIPLQIIVLFFVVSFVISRWSGWARLAERFRAPGPFLGECWKRQSARFRAYCGYNNCLTVGADAAGLYLSVMSPFRVFHAPLLIPWQEIEVETGKVLFGFYDTALLRLGRDEQIPMRIQGKLIERLRQAAGASWPLYQVDLMKLQQGD